LWKNVPLLRIPLGFIGIPIAVLGSVFTCLMPSMGEIESRVTKLLLCQTWPFSLDCLAYTSGKDIGGQDEYSVFGTVLYGLVRRGPAIRQYINNREIVS